MSRQLDATVREDTVEFRFTIENTGCEPVSLNFRRGLTADFAVYDADTEVWRWSDGRMFTQMLQTETLNHGETTEYHATWETACPGDFTAVATLEATQVNVETTTTFTI